MTNKQHPIGSGFTAASTAAEVVEGIDLTGRNVIVTAGHVGLGLETTRALANAGANVVVASRNPATATAALSGIGGIEARASVASRSTSSTSSTPPRSRPFAERYRDSGRPLHILINNAGIMGGDLVRDPRGYEQQFATNHLGHFQLTHGLLPALRKAGGARVVEVSSWGHHLSDIRWDDPHFEQDYDGMVAYGQSKTANVLFAVELDRQWADDGIRGYSLHPGGIVSTNLGPSFSIEDWRAMGLVDDADQPIIDPGQRHEDTRAGRLHDGVRRDQPAARRHRWGVPGRQRHRPPGGGCHACGGRPGIGAVAHHAGCDAICRRPGIRSASVGPEREVAHRLITIPPELHSTRL